MTQKEAQYFATICNMFYYGWSMQEIADRIHLSIQYVEGVLHAHSKTNSFVKRDFDVSENELMLVGIYDYELLKHERTVIYSDRMSFSERLNLAI